MNYHNIINISPYNLKEIIKFASELTEFQNEISSDYRQWYECCDVIKKYMEVNTNMYVVLSTIALAFDYDLRMFDTGKDIYDLDSILTNSSVFQPQTLNGIQLNKDNIDMFANLVIKAAAPNYGDRFLPMYFIDLLYYNTESIRVNLSLYNTMSPSELTISNILLDAVAILQRRINPTSNLMTSTNDVQLVSSTLGTDVISMLSDVIFGNIMSLQRTTEEECQKYLVQCDTIPYLLYTYIIPTICISGVVGLYETLRLIRRILQWKPQ